MDRKGRPTSAAVLCSHRLEPSLEVKQKSLSSQRTATGDAAALPINFPGYQETLDLLFLILMGSFLACLHADFTHSCWRWRLFSFLGPRTNFEVCDQLLASYPLKLTTKRVNSLKVIKVSLARYRLSFKNLAVKNDGVPAIVGTKIELVALS